MNFYELLLTSEKRNAKRFSELTEAAVNRHEKELRLENKMEAASGLEPLLNFIKALQEYPAGLDFLMDNPNVCQAIFLQNARFNTSHKMQLEGYQKAEIQRFFSQILQVDLESAIGEAAAKKQYLRFAQLAKFNQYFPEDITLLLKSKISDALDRIKVRVDGGVIGVFKELDLIKPILIFLGDQPLMQREKAIQRIAVSNSLKDVGKPGIVAFFNMIGESIEAVNTQPDSLIEKEKKKETLGGCRWVFMVVFGITIGCFIFVKSCIPGVPEKMETKEYPANNKRSDKFPAYLTDVNRTEITKYEYVGPPRKRERPLDKQFGFYPTDMPLYRGPAITNESSYDLIILSTENQFETEETASAAATYIRSSKDGYAGVFYVNRLYFGDSLSLFNTHYDTANVTTNDSLLKLLNTPKDKIYSTTKRFLAQPAFAKEAIAYRIRFASRSTVTIRDTLDRVIIDGTGSVTLFDRDSIKKRKTLPFIFPPL